MSDIVERLREGTQSGTLTPIGEFCVEAAALHDEYALVSSAST